MSKLLKSKKWKEKSKLAESAFKALRDKICKEFEMLEDDFVKMNNSNKSLKAAKFIYNSWKRDEKNGGGGITSIMKGSLFEKVGVNISTVKGNFSNDFKTKIKGAQKDPGFYATGISVVAHMNSPFIPAAHMNTRFIMTTDAWFGGGCDLTPTFKNASIYNNFHNDLKKMCDYHDSLYYKKFSKWCNEYFYLPHRKEERGIGGIFYDYLDCDWDKNFLFTKNVGDFFLKHFSTLITKNYKKKWSVEDRLKLLEKRSRYVEFNLLYDRGTIFGLKTGGNPDAILMSLPPEVKWP